MSTSDPSVRDTGSAVESIARPGPEADPRDRVRPATPALEGLVRDSLGCTCPPEVFSRVEQDRAPVPNLPEIRCRIAVGDRLLIYLAEPPDPARAAARVGDWVRAGRAERDRRRMNRLRLVVALDTPNAEVVRAVETAFSRVPELGPPGDPRIHLHCLPRSLLEPILSPSQE